MNMNLRNTVIFILEPFITKTSHVRKAVAGLHNDQLLHPRGTPGPRRVRSRRSRSGGEEVLETVLRGRQSCWVRRFGRIATFTKRKTRNEVQVLQKEGQKLASTLSKAFPNDARATWTIESLQDAVAKTQQTWEAKERLGKGRPQALFHGLMQKFDTHSHLFEVIPQGDLYTSLITGGAMIVVKVCASARLRHPRH